MDKDEVVVVEDADFCVVLRGLLYFSGLNLQVDVVRSTAVCAECS